MNLNLDFPKPICKPEPQGSQKGTGGVCHLTSGLPPSVKRLRSERISHPRSEKPSMRKPLKLGFHSEGGLG